MTTPMAWAMKDTTTENAWRQGFFLGSGKSLDLLWFLMACPLFCSFNKRFWNLKLKLKIDKQTT